MSEATTPPACLPATPESITLSLLLGVIVGRLNTLGMSHEETHAIVDEALRGAAQLLDKRNEVQRLIDDAVRSVGDLTTQSK